MNASSRVDPSLFKLLPDTPDQRQLTLGGELRRVRELRGATLKSVAEPARISSTYLLKLEHDEVQLPVATCPCVDWPNALMSRISKPMGMWPDTMSPKFSNQDSALACLPLPLLTSSSARTRAVRHF